MPANLIRTLFVRALPFIALVSANTLVAQDAAPEQLMVVDYTYEDPTNSSKSFRMQVPADWNVKENFGGYALFMEPKEKAVATAEQPIVADPNISVAVVNDPKHIDEQGLEDYAKEIETKFRASNGSNNEFNIFAKHLLTDLPDGKRALMYYITYINNGVDVGSTILLMSNSENMYRVTYTDYRVTYEKNFERFYPIMASLQINGTPPEREFFLKPVIPYFVGIGLIILVFAILRQRKVQHMKRILREAESESLED